jgi:hypothetical protein
LKLVTSDYICSYDTSHRVKNDDSSSMLQVERNLWWLRIIHHPLMWSCWASKLRIEIHSVRYYSELIFQSHLSSHWNKSWGIASFREFILFLRVDINGVESLRETNVRCEILIVQHFSMTESFFYFSTNNFFKLF